MALTVEQLQIVVNAEVKNAISGLKKTEKASTNFSKQFKNVAKDIAGPLAAGLIIKKVFDIGSEFSKLASNAEEVSSKFKAVFKDQSDSVEKWAEDYAEGFGRGITETKDFLAKVQDTLVPLGFARTEAADFSKEIVTLAGDLASFNNMPTEEVVNGISSALVGNVENLRRYGVVATESSIKQEALNSGIWDGEGALTAQEKASAILAITLKSTSDAQGDLAATMQSNANVLVSLESQWTTTGELLGASINTVVTPLASAFAELLKSVNETIISKRELKEAVEILNTTLAGNEDRIKAINVLLEDEYKKREQLLTQNLNFSELHDYNIKQSEKEIGLLDAKLEREQLLEEHRFNSEQLSKDRADAEAQRAQDKEDQDKEEADRIKQQADDLTSYLELVRDEYSQTDAGIIAAKESEIELWEQYAETAVNTLPYVQEILDKKREELEVLIELKEKEDDLADSVDFASRARDVAAKKSADQRKTELDELKEIEDLYKDLGKTISGFASGPLEEVGKAIVEGGNAWVLAASAAVSSVANIVRALAEEAVIQSAMSFASGNIPGGIAYAGAATAAFISAGVIEALADKNTARITPAATGADFITDGPQLMMVGENATGRERVQVTPIGTPNINGPQQAPIHTTVEIDGNALFSLITEASRDGQIRTYQGSVVA